MLTGLIYLLDFFLNTENKVQLNLSLVLFSGLEVICDQYRHLNLLWIGVADKIKETNIAALTELDFSH